MALAFRGVPGHAPPTVQLAVPRLDGARGRDGQIAATFLLVHRCRSATAVAPPIRALSRRRRRSSAWAPCWFRLLIRYADRHRDQRRRCHADLGRAYPGQRNLVSSVFSRTALIGLASGSRFSASRPSPIVLLSLALGGPQPS